MWFLKFISQQIAEIFKGKWLAEGSVCRVRGLGGEKKQQQWTEMAARQGLSQKNPGWYTGHFLGAKTKTENWARGTSMQFENPVDFTMYSALHRAILAINHYLPYRREASMLCWKQQSNFPAAKQNTARLEWQSPGFGTTTSGREARNLVTSKDDSSVKVLLQLRIGLFIRMNAFLYPILTVTTIPPPILYQSIWPQSQ